MAGIVVIFDFDKTIIDFDSDNWVLDELGATELFNQLLPTMAWNPLMDRMMKELHSQGIKIEDIVAVLKRTPIHPRIIEAIKSAHALGCDLRIVSDANMFFIDTILEHHGLKECFSEIHTNPGFVNEENRLRIFPHYDSTKSPHKCHNPCPPNMCKGMVIESIQASMANDDEKKTIIYLGDGIGDYCSIVKLRDGDYAMPRKNFPVWDLVCQNRGLIKAQVCEWSNGEEFEHVLLHLISKISIDKINYAQQYSVHDCRQQTLLQGPGHQQGYKFRTKATKLRLVIPTQLTSFGNFNQFRPISTKTSISIGNIK
ncbi:HAD-superfamily hydrolase, subfamily IB, PSPase-like protein [Corchorus olitorius]|uniref:HAD-superfamily hydrolase, subfamily IB, PSPase-like protein n=1 Tax=Corchorus olitorius TaxID=93759 RepID=A0A1R3H7N1_9ROSI|nr:HAD-superfamily hydrolase, subfamily IB, PSPase-like protein [Corchorus olitorius]